MKSQLEEEERQAISADHQSNTTPHSPATQPDSATPQMHLEEAEGAEWGDLGEGGEGGEGLDGMERTEADDDVTEDATLHINKLGTQQNPAGGLGGGGLGGNGENGSKDHQLDQPPGFTSNGMGEEGGQFSTEDDDVEHIVFSLAKDKPREDEDDGGLDEGGGGSTNSTSNGDGGGGGGGGTSSTSSAGGGGGTGNESGTQKDTPTEALRRKLPPTPYSEGECDSIDDLHQQVADGTTELKEARNPQLAISMVLLSAILEAWKLISTHALKKRTGKVTLAEVQKIFKNVEVR